MIRIGPGLAIDETEVDERFVRASGPGGQNVNKVSTAVELRFDVAASSLLDDVKGRLIDLAGSNMKSDGILAIHRDRKSTRRNCRHLVMSYAFVCLG